MSTNTKLASLRHRKNSATQAKAQISRAFGRAAALTKRARPGFAHLARVREIKKILLGIVVWTNCGLDQKEKPQRPESNSLPSAQQASALAATLWRWLRNRPPQQ